MSLISDLPSRLIRFDVDSIESMIRPLRFSFARSSSPLRSLPSATSPICSSRSRGSRRGSPPACRRRRRSARCPRTGTRTCRRSRPCRASRGSPGRAATTPSRRGARRAATRRSGARSERAIPGAPMQTWYCSVSLRWKRTLGRGGLTSGLRRRGPRAGAFACLRSRLSERARRGRRGRGSRPRRRRCCRPRYIVRW